MSQFVSQSIDHIATARPRELLNRARRILDAANCEGRDLTDIETGRIDELLDIVSLAIDRERRAGILEGARS